MGGLSQEKQNVHKKHKTTQENQDKIPIKRKTCTGTKLYTTSLNFILD